MSNNNGENIKGIEHKTGTKGYRNIWILPFGTLMTVIMILFLILYALSSISGKLASERYLVQLESSLGTKTSEQMKFVEAAAEIEGSFTNRGLQKLANVEINAERIRVVMAAPILFSAGSADLNVNALPILNELSRILQALPNKVTVEGHTCDLPVGTKSKYRSNLELSGARAFSVIRYFIETGKTNPDKFIALGCGENVPVSPNDCEENRSLNRRVEILIEK